MKTHLLYILCLLLPLGALAKGDNSKRKEFVKELKREFKMQENGVFSVANKHGEVNIKTWDKAEVKVDVKIIVQALDEERAAHIFERIQIEIKNGKDFVDAITHISKKKKSSMYWSSWNGAESRDEFKIDYEIYVPSTAVLHINNKYGAAFVAPTNGLVKADISYGSIRIDEVNNDLSLDLNYGNATILKATSVVAEVNYSNFGIREAGDIDLNSKYSKLKIEKVNTLRIFTKYDEFNIGDAGSIRSEGKYGKFQISEVNQLIVDGKYTDYLVGMLGKNADIQLVYGGLQVESIKKGFGEIRLSGSYANFKIMTEHNSSYKIDANISYGEVSLPDNIEKTYERNSNYAYKVEGQVGEASSSCIKVKVSYGGVEVR